MGISKPDGSGAAVETDLLDAARRNWARVLSYAQRYEQDSSVAADILETVLLAISRARGSRRNSGSPIRNLDSYLYVAFIRRLNRYVAKQPKIEFVGSLQNLDALSGNQTRGSAPTVEDDLLVRELLRYMNQRAAHFLAENERLLLERNRTFPKNHGQQCAGSLQQGRWKGPRPHYEAKRLEETAW